MPLLRSSIRFCLCVPRVSYRALPSFHPGLCRSVALSGLIVVLGVCGVVFVKCAWMCKWIVAFVRVFVWVAVLCLLNVFECVNGLLHSFVYLYVIVWGVVLCSLNVLGCVNGLLRSFVFLYVIVWVVVWCSLNVFGCVNCWCGRAMSPFRGDTPA